MAYFVGIDIGGTFTDAVLLDDSGTARPPKTDDKKTASSISRTGWARGRPPIFGAGR